MNFDEFMSEGKKHSDEEDRSYGDGSVRQGNRLPMKNFQSIKRRSQGKRSGSDAFAKSKKDETTKKVKGKGANVKRNQAWGGESEQQYNPLKYRKIKADLRDTKGGSVKVPGKPPYKSSNSSYTVTRGKDKMDKWKPSKEDMKAIEKMKKNKPTKPDSPATKLAKKSLEKAFKKKSEGHPKIEEGYKALPVEKIYKQMVRPHALKDTKKFKQMAQQRYEYGADHAGWGEGGMVRKRKEEESPAKLEKEYKKRRQDKEKDNRSGRGTHQKVVPGVTGSKIDALDDTFKKKSKGHPKIEEGNGFTDFLEFYKREQPKYQVEGKLPQCPPGFRFDREKMDCVPKTRKDGVKGKLYDKDGTKSSNHFNVWGRTGINGDGYAYEEPANGMRGGDEVSEF